MDKTQFELSELPVTIHSIWDEQDRDDLLTLVVEGDHGVSGFLMLHAEADDDGEIDVCWKWLVNEPNQQEAYTGVEDSLMLAADELRSAMADMAEFVRERDGE